MLRSNSVRGLALGFLLLSLIGAGTAFRYTTQHLGINTDTVDMLAEELSERARETVSFRRKLTTSRRRAAVVSREDIRGCARACLLRVPAANRLA